ncbi:CRTAC1 family protein [Acidipila rosea]|uniref:Tfp pilus assembly protein PilF n=1 Tax=Acidipila rosea TaxID=768535 RepID=A0A4R1L438_9BACT|nr:CRTAC1 family protein [Acidipila rosea]TCK72828.1 Tfp pilus assembly protein PilF [Acidipila rosea]
MTSLHLSLNPPPSRRTIASRSPNLWLLALACIAAALGGCRSHELPNTASQPYREEVKNFYVGLAALQVGDDVRADSALKSSTELAPGEPAAWANWGVLALRQGNFELSAERLAKAQKLAPQNDHILYLQGLLESKRGNSQAAIDLLRRAVAANPRNTIATYLLAQEAERQGGAEAEAEFERLLEGILKAQPENQAAMVELARAAAKQGDAATLKNMVAQLRAGAASWPAPVQQQMTELEAAAAGSDLRAAAVRTAFLRNTLMRVPEFRRSVASLQPAAGDEAAPFTHFLRLATPAFTPAAPDTGISFHIAPAAVDSSGAWSWIGALSLNGEGAPVVAAANGQTVRLASGASIPFPGGSRHVAPGEDSVLSVDFNYDFKMDLVLAGDGGVRFLRQDSPRQFTDVSTKTGLPAAVLNAPYTGAWALDVEADGDMDVLLGSSSGEPLVLRNNGDGTFASIHPFHGISGVRDFAWIDLDGDGNPDAVLMDSAGALHILHNDRGGVFHEMPLPAGVEQVKAICSADVDGGGTLSLIAVEATGSIVGIARTDGPSQWTITELARVPDATSWLQGDVRLHSADMDNNGAVDLVLTHNGAETDAKSGALLWLGRGQGQFTSATQIVGPDRIFAIADLNSDGRLDLLGLSPSGAAKASINAGTKAYRWQVIRPRARQATGDQRINSFGIGGEMEIRSGLLTQRQAIDGPQLHFGLGDQDGVDVVRILWPNGTERAEFALKANQEVLTEQRLKGSCPFLFAWNGKEMAFVKDTVPWGSAIGLQIDSIGSPRIAATEEWYKIAGNQIVPRNGYYDLRITGELWETYYYDFLKLMVVDHPAGTEVFTDERFAVPAVKLQVTATGPLQPIARAVDDTGRDVTEIVRTQDRRYLDTFGRGQYQGLTRDHFVEIDLGRDAPATGPLWLVADGWLHPTDSTVNVALRQGHAQKAEQLSLDVPDGHGGWMVARSNLGFPAGRNKTCLFNLEGLFRPGTERKLRLRTNLEIYWDAIHWAKGLPETQLKMTKLQPSLAELDYRGYSVVRQANASSPELPDYNQLASTTQVWRDLEGYYTRYGDVRPLLKQIDDRYVIMNAGDEMRLRFPALAPPQAGWVRDYVIMGDGWIKDGDYNSLGSRTVRPLPYHAQTLYGDPTGTLEKEWVYRHHPEDWQQYQTRYITPAPFDDALRSNAAQ